MLTSDFDYSLPEELIAQEPPQRRASSRMMMLDISSGEASILPFGEIADFLRSGDCLTVNNTRVIKARLFAQRPSGAKLEIFLLARNGGVESYEWSCLIKPGKRAKPGTELPLLDKAGAPSKYSIGIVGPKGDGEFLVRLNPAQMDEILASCGHIPLPPYIKRSDEAADSERYQTVYAKEPGSVAAPTAGLHFDSETLQAIEAKGVKRAELTLHVGQGTFKPVSAERLEDHKMHSEEYTLPASTAEILNCTRKVGGRIMAAGTTSLRVLETCVGPDRLFAPQSGSTSIFIHPPQRPISADILLTNFHLPKSTLLMLVCSFAGSREMVLEAYRKAVAERMRFFSYGDCMLLRGRKEINIAFAGEDSGLPGEARRRSIA